MQRSVAEPRISAHPKIALVVVLTIVGIAYLLWPRHKPETGVPAGSVYYTGPMKAKGGTTYGNEDGTLAAAPAAP